MVPDLKRTTCNLQCKLPKLAVIADPVSRQEKKRGGYRGGVHVGVGRPGYYSGVSLFAFGEGAKLAPGHPASPALSPVC